MGKRKGLLREEIITARVGKGSEIKCLPRTQKAGGLILSTAKIKNY